MLFGTNLPTLGSTGGMLGQMFGGGKSWLGQGWDYFSGLDLFAGVLHGGGMPTNANEFRSFPASVVDFAPRRHGGYNPLKPGESLNVLRNDERVLSPGETRAYNAGVAAGGGTAVSGGKQELHFDLEGAVLTGDLVRQMNRIGRVSGRMASDDALARMSGYQVDRYYEAG